MHVCWVCALVFQRSSKLHQHEQSEAHIQRLINQVLCREPREEAEPLAVRRRQLAGLDEENSIVLTLCSCALEWRLGSCDNCSINSQWSEATLRRKLAQKQSVRQGVARDSRSRRNVLARGLTNRTDDVSKVEYEKETYDNRGILQTLRDSYKERKEAARQRQSQRSLLLPSSQRSTEMGSRLVNVPPPKPLEKAQRLLRRIQSTVQEQRWRKRTAELSMKVRLERSPLVASETRKQHFSAPLSLKDKLLSKVQVAEFIFS